MRLLITPNFFLLFCLNTNGKFGLDILSPTKTKKQKKKKQCKVTIRFILTILCWLCELKSNFIHISRIALVEKIDLMIWNGKPLWQKPNSLRANDVKWTKANGAPFYNFMVLWTYASLLCTSIRFFNVRVFVCFFLFHSEAEKNIKISLKYLHLIWMCEVDGSMEI